MKGERMKAEGGSQTRSIFSSKPSVPNSAARSRDRISSNDSSSPLSERISPRASPCLSNPCGAPSKRHPLTVKISSSFSSRVGASLAVSTRHPVGLSVLIWTWMIRFSAVIRKLSHKQPAPGNRSFCRVSGQRPGSISLDSGHPGAPIFAKTAISRQNRPNRRNARTPAIWTSARPGPVSGSLQGSLEPAKFLRTGFQIPFLPPAHV